MKIACLIHSLDGGGAERVMAGLASRLAGRGHNVTLITLGDGSGDRHKLSRDVARINLDLMSESSNPISAIRNLFRRIKAIRQTTRSLSPNVVLSFCDRTNVLAGLSVGGRTAVVLSERSDPHFQTLPKLWRILRRYAYQKSDTIVVQTDSASAFFDSFGVPCSVIPSAVDPPPLTGKSNGNSYTSDRSAAISNRQVIAIGRLSPEKGLDRLIEAFAIVHRQNPDWKLRILGEGAMRSTLQDQINRLNLSEAVSMPGWAESVWGELAGSTVFVLPSHYEGFPSALLEAMSVGVPSIALQNQAGSRAIVDSGVNGILAGEDAVSIAAAIDSLIQNPELREQLGEAGKNVVSRFSWESMVDQYETVLRSVVNSPDALD